jgi:type I restriction enzyme M protein
MACNSEERRTLQQKLTDYKRRMIEKIARESRQSLKESFAYPIFLYEAEKVGITATGDSDENELFPNERQPTGISKTCLELYQEFRVNPNQFLMQ